MPKQIGIRAFLEMDDGAFCATSRILQSPELQKRCIEKRALKRIVRLLEQHNLTPADLKKSPKLNS
jgi:hypothetical protein